MNLDLENMQAGNSNIKDIHERAASRGPRRGRQVSAFSKSQNRFCNLEKLKKVNLIFCKFQKAQKKHDFNFFKLKKA